MDIDSSILSWRIPWTEEPGRLTTIGSQRAGHDWATYHACTKDKSNRESRSIQEMKKIKKNYANNYTHYQISTKRMLENFNINM